MTEIHYLVSEQTDGRQKDLSHSIATDSIEDAEDFFVDAKERLLDVNNWKRYSSPGNPEFMLTDHHGHTLKRRARKGDHIRIDSEGLEHSPGGGFSWVVIEAIEYDDYPDESIETFAIRLRPSASPLPGNKTGPGYFFNEEATSTFVIERNGKNLYATWHGRNEPNELTPGQSQPETGIPWLGLSDRQCETLVKGFLK